MYSGIFKIFPYKGIFCKYFYNCQRQQQYKIKPEKQHDFILILCPGFSQDRVNFHQKPGADTARQADPNWPKNPGYSVPCAIMLGAEAGICAPSGESCSVQFIVCLYILLISIIIVTDRFLRCSVKLPLSRPTNFAFFFPFSSLPQQGEERYSNHVALCCRPRAKL